MRVDVMGYREIKAQPPLADDTVVWMLNEDGDVVGAEWNEDKKAWVPERPLTEIIFSYEVPDA